ncbi:MAG: Fmu (Sun) domain protein [Niabella sp.]|nr:Fmu (Sun) domain protein [Niabella sp.]
MQLPRVFIHSLQGLPGFDENAFVATHIAAAPVTSVRLNPIKVANAARIIADNAIEKSPVPWCANGYYLSRRPSFTFDPLFHAGCYYVQEASSMFLEQALRQTTDLTKGLNVLDLCAAPGGKSTHIQSLISEQSVLVSNEIIKSRAAILRDNIIKWGGANVVVSNNDPKDFERLPGFFDVIVVDAPCSGSGLFRRDETAIDEWSEQSVALCSQRQQRILADVLPALREDGVLIYSTCSYSQQEDEAILEWLLASFDLESIPLTAEPEWNITEVHTAAGWGYRFWPHRVKGEGLFMTVLRKRNAAGNSEKYRPKTKALPTKEVAALGQWMDITDRSFVSFGDKIYSWPTASFEVFDFLAQRLKVIYSGVLTGALVRDKLIPDHALAMSRILNETAGKKTELPLTDAIRYLQRKDLSLDNAATGWQRATFKGFPLGWMNVLPNRINNYYPKELRILKELKPE